MISDNANSSNSGDMYGHVLRPACVRLRLLGVWCEDRGEQCHGFRSLRE